MTNLIDFVLGPCIRAIPPNSKGAPRLFLTFDDGPNSIVTPQVLDLLRKHGAKATFFLVAKRAEAELSITRRIVEEGHGIGNHSLDHQFRSFFASRKTLQAWIEASEALLLKITGAPSLGFRSPAGVRTPPLRSVLSRLKIPLIHWSSRFYDTQREWTVPKAERALSSAFDGQIVLLHDVCRGQGDSDFLATLDHYLTKAQANGFTLCKLTHADVVRVSR